MSVKVDLNSRNYTNSDIGEEDPRLVSGRKDAVFVQVILGIFTVMPIATGYMLSPTIAELQAGAELKVLLGYPLWVMIPVFMYVIEYVILLIYVTKFMKTPSLEARMSLADEREV